MSGQTRLPGEAQPGRNGGVWESRPKIGNAQHVAWGSEAGFAGGEQLWSRFKGCKEGTLWYYEELAERFNRLVVPKSLVEELNCAVTTMRQLTR
jgi:hypothetical protein